VSAFTPHVRIHTSTLHSSELCRHPPPQTLLVRTSCRTRREVVEGGSTRQWGLLYKRACGKLVHSKVVECWAGCRDSVMWLMWLAAVEQHAAPWASRNAKHLLATTATPVLIVCLSSYSAGQASTANQIRRSLMRTFGARVRAPLSQQTCLSRLWDRKTVFSMSGYTIIRSCEIPS